MKLWIVSLRDKCGYLWRVQVVRAATEEDAAGLVRVWPEDQTEVRRLTEDGKPGVILSDGR